MEVEWSTSRCIICGAGDNISREHVIPRSIGGKLVAKFLCRVCNSRLGEGAESAVRNDPEIRKSIERLGHARPDLRDDLQKGLPYIGRSELGEVHGFWRKGEFITKEQELTDKSLIVPVERTFHHVKCMAAREGRGPLWLTDGQLKTLPPGASVEVAPGILVKNWAIEEIKPDLDGPEMDPVVPAKIAFEFLAWRCGEKIYENPAPLASIRKQLVHGSLSKDEICVQRLKATNPRLFHGLVFEGNKPGARVQIRLYGSLAFRVDFRHIAVHCTRYGYTHNLLTGHDGTWEAA